MKKQTLLQFQNPIRVMLCLLAIMLSLAPLSAQTHTFGGSGTSADPFIITSADELAEMATLVNDPATNATYGRACYSLNNDIDLSAYGVGFNGTMGWIPIGKYIDLYDYQLFEGSFDGNNHIITGLYIDVDTATSLVKGPGHGLFGDIGGATIENLGVEDIYVKAPRYVGGLVGKYSSEWTLPPCRISNCYTTGTVSGGQFVGGLACYIERGIIENCYSTATVTETGTATSSACGGLMGGVYTSTISNCYSTGAVSGYNNVGGFAGTIAGGGGVLIYSKVENCYSTGAVNGNNFVGGFTGIYVQDSINNCYSTGAVSGNDYIGGFIGGPSSSPGDISFVSNCYSVSDVSGNLRVGGFLGSPYSYSLTNPNSINHGQMIQIFNCYSAGAISGTDYVGGLAGGAVIGITDCMALNPSVKGTGANVWRVGKSTKNSTIYSWGGNIAWDGMVNQSNTTVWNNKGMAEDDGGDISAWLLYVDEAYRNYFTAANGWTLQPGKLPGLLGEAVDMPAHLVVTDAPEIISQTLPNGNLGATYNQTIAAGGILPMAWSITAGSLPAGLTLDASEGIISGVPTATGTFTFTVNVVNIIAITDSKQLSITIDAALPPQITTASLPAGAVGTAYTATLAASGSIPLWSISSGSLPAGLNLNASTGEISGIPTAGGTFNFSVGAANSAGNDTKALSITVTGGASGPTFVAVANITGVPSAATAGTPLTLTGTVAPANATNSDIIWNVKSAGATGATISGNTFYATSSGTVTITATIAAGTSPTTAYTQDFTITVTGGGGASGPTFVAVTNITGVPSTAVAGTPLALTGTVVPTNATNRDIIWNVKSAGTTFATISGSTLYTISAGTITITATIAAGSSPTGIYTKDFVIVITTPTAVENVEHPNPLKAWTQNGTLYISLTAAGESSPVRVYSTTGVLVYQGITTGSDVAGSDVTHNVATTIPLPARGIYIVTDGKTVIKVVN